ncbi:hypothetical protein OAG53_01030 [Akkermansiaceae bacterium]|nr:hypothetical protein [Akkermansiaceae bacterium]
MGRQFLNVRIKNYLPVEMQYACRIIFSLFSLGCAVALMMTPHPGGWGWNMSALLGLIVLIIGTPVAFFLGKKIDRAWHDY